jgi:hypothetical protein
MKSSSKIALRAIASAFAFTAVSAFAQSAPAVKEDAMQLRSDKAALQRQINRMDADEARLKSDTASGRMSAESKDAYSVYKQQLAIKGEKKDIADDKAFSLQMKLDKAGLQRQIKRLDVAEARLKADAKEGKMAAESKDADKVYKDQLTAAGEKKDVSADKASLKADEKK